MFLSPFLFATVVWHLRNVIPMRSKPCVWSAWGSERVRPPVWHCGWPVLLRDHSILQPLWLIRGAGAFCCFFFFRFLCTLVCVDLDLAPGVFAHLLGWDVLQTLGAMCDRAGKTDGCRRRLKPVKAPRSFFLLECSQWQMASYWADGAAESYSQQFRRQGHRPPLPSTHHSSCCFNLASLASNRKQRNASCVWNATSSQLPSKENAMANLCASVVPRHHTASVPFVWKIIHFSFFLEVEEFWKAGFVKLY